MEDYNNISELRNYIKSLLRELTQIENKKHIVQEDLLDRVVFLLELYVKQEVKLELIKQLGERDDNL